MEPQHLPPRVVWKIQNNTSPEPGTVRNKSKAPSRVPGRVKVWWYLAHACSTYLISSFFLFLPPNLCFLYSKGSKSHWKSRDISPDKYRGYGGKKATLLIHIPQDSDIIQISLLSPIFTSSKSLGSGVRLSVPKSQLCHPLGRWSQVRNSTSQTLGFLSIKQEE